MYIGFLNDRKKLKSLIQEKKTIFVETRKGQKRKLVSTIVLGGALIFGPLKACANLPDSNKMSYETLIDFNRGGFSPRPINMETFGRQLSQEYNDYQKDFNSPPLSNRFDTIKFSQQRFRELAKDPNARTEVYHKKTVDEARSALHAEMLGIVNEVKRIPQPYCKSVDLDFSISGPTPFTHLDLKHPVGSSILKKQNSPYTLKEASRNMGKSVVNQKQRFCGLEKGPVSSKNVLHVVDLCYVPKNEKEIVKNFCLEGASSSEGILFINTK